MNRRGEGAGARGAPDGTATALGQVGAGLTLASCRPTVWSGYEAGPGANAGGRWARGPYDGAAAAVGLVHTVLAVLALDRSARRELEIDPILEVQGYELSTA